MKNSVRILGLALIGLTGLSTFSHAAIQSGTIHCDEINSALSEDGSSKDTKDYVVGTINITLNERGEASVIKVDRKPTAGNRPVRLELTKLNSTFQHEMIRNKEPAATKLGSRVEHISAVDLNGQSVFLNLHTHSEDGQAASTIEIVADGKTIKPRAENHQLICIGSTKRPATDHAGMLADQD